MTVLLTPAEAAAALRISTKTLRGHVRDGSIRYVVIGRGTKRPRIGFAAADLSEFEERQRRRQAPESKSAPCRSTASATPPSITSTSGAAVIAFSALQARARDAKR